MLTTLSLVACLNLALQGSCVTVFITDSDQSPAMTQVSCLHLGLPIAIAFMTTHPEFARPKWHFGGYTCETASRRVAKRGSA